jgi:hypothetical protein
MTNFGKSALQYKYVWPAKDGKLTPVLYNNDDVIDMKNGYHILSFINRFMAVHGLTNLGSFQKLEWMLCRYMPRDLYYRYEIEDWLRKNWGQRVFLY